MIILGNCKNITNFLQIFKKGVLCPPYCLHYRSAANLSISITIVQELDISADGNLLILTNSGLFDKRIE